MLKQEPFVETRREMVAERLSLLLEDRKELVPTYLFEAARYATFPTGKLLRPLLAIACGEALGAPIEVLLSPACALEIIHTYSLIHDDLPCMDDDDFRRGKPSLHKAYPEAHAVLTGDFLLTYAFEILSCAPDLSDEKKIKLIHTLSLRIGAEGMLGGQALDIAYTGEAIDWNTLKQIHLGKTAALLQTAVEFGAIIGGATAEQVQILQNFAQFLGLAFQIQDDILDVQGSMSALGKPTGSDQKKQKLTACNLLGIDNAHKKVCELHKSAYQQLNQLSMDTRYLQQLANRMLPTVL